MVAFNINTFLFIAYSLQLTSSTSGFRSSVLIPTPSADIHVNGRVISPYQPASIKSSTRLSAALQHVDDSNMNELIFSPSKEKPRSVLVDAYAIWCGPCKLCEPFLLNCAETHSDKLSVIKYNVEASNTKNLKVEMLLQGVMVRGLPTLILYHDGKPLATHSGAITESDLNTWLEDNLFSKVDVLTGDILDGSGGGSTAKKSPTQELDKKKENMVRAKRGFVSMTSQFGADDYMLSND